MILANSYLLPPHLAPHLVLQSCHSQAPPTLHLLSAHTVATIFILGSRVPHNSVPHHSPPTLPSTHSSSTSPALATRLYLPSASAAFCLLPFVPLFLPFLPSLFLFIQILSLLRGLWKLAFSVVPASENEQVTYFPTIAVFSCKTASYPPSPILVFKDHCAL